MAILGIDYGKKRIGLAKSDELMMFAHPIGYIELSIDKAKFINELKNIIEENNIDKIIVGMPIKLNGEKDIAALEVEKFIEFLKENIKLDILEWDERLTTQEANRHMRNYTVSGKKKRKKIDALASQIMLQSFLDTNRLKKW